MFAITADPLLNTLISSGGVQRTLSLVYATSELTSIGPFSSAFHELQPHFPVQQLKDIHVKALLFFMEKSKQVKGALISY